MKILALDPATKCGWAVWSGQSGTWDLSVRRDESGGMRLMRLMSKLNEIKESVGIDVVVFEAARHGMPGMQGALVVQSELQGTIKLWCEQQVPKVEYRGVSPSEIKKHATGKGNAGKPMMIDAAEKRWRRTFEDTDDNEVDALWLLVLAQEVLLK